MTPRPRHKSDPRDVALLTSLTTGSSEAWRAFLQRFENLILACISRTLSRSGFTNERCQVEDVFSEVVCSMLKNDARRIRQYREERGCAPSSWVGLITVSTTLDYVRREKRHRWSLCEVDELDRLAPAVAGPDQDYDHVEHRELVNRALGSCTARDREFAALYFGEGLPPVQVAERLGVEVATVYSRRVKFQRRLQRAVNEQIVN